MARASGAGERVGRELKEAPHLIRPTAPATIRPGAQTPLPEGGSGSSRVEGNARLTGTLGVVLLVLLAAEGVTVLAIHRLLPWHYFFGFVLIPPVLLKIGSTGLRFVRYYNGDSDYRRDGPPQLLLRLLGPPIVLLTLAVFATGVELWAFGIRFGAIWLTAHKVSFVLWFVVMTVHVMAYIWRSPTLALRDLAAPTDGTVTRQSMVAAGIVMGVVLALVLASVYVSPFANLGGG